MIQKLKQPAALRRILARLRRRGKRVVFTNGCFDLIHPGHIRYLERARRMGDVLVVGINSDASVRRIKGRSRPVIPERERAEVLAALGCVDYVTIFPEPDPLAIIQTLQPDILVKGSDWGRNAIIGRRVVESYGGMVRRIPLLKGYSTTGLLKHITGNRGPRDPV
jgi:D-beta-D-heptose 7-phosphate kinase/D-beta-D-heptose 1-phosphate adenosyltransferase